MERYAKFYITEEDSKPLYLLEVPNSEVGSFTRAGFVPSSSEDGMIERFPSYRLDDFRDVFNGLSVSPKILDSAERDKIEVLLSTEEGDSSERLTQAIRDLVD